MQSKTRNQIAAEIKRKLEEKAKQPDSLVEIYNNCFIVYGFQKIVKKTAESFGQHLGDQPQDLTLLCKEAFGVWLRLMRKRVTE